MTHLNDFSKRSFWKQTFFAAAALCTNFVLPNTLHAETHHKACIPPDYIEHAGNHAGLGYAQLGNGPTLVVVLHQWLRDHIIYTPTMCDLADEQFTYLFVDIRGYGLSSLVKGADYSANEVGRDVFALVESLGFKKFHLVGHSMSGLFAQNMLLQPDAYKILSLELISPVPASGFKLSSVDLEKLRQVATDNQVLKTTLIARTSHRYDDEWYTDEITQSRASYTLEALNQYLKTFTRTDVQNAVHTAMEERGYSLPVKAIVGQYDIDAYKYKAVLMRLTDLYGNSVTITEIPNAGHYSMEEEPKRFAMTLKTDIKAMALRVAP